MIHFPAATRAIHRAGLCAALLALAGCATMNPNYFPPRNLGEAKHGPGDLRGATVLVSMNPQLQLDGEAQERARGRAPARSVTEYHGRLLGMVKERLEKQGARVATELHDRNDLGAAKLPEVVARERADYLLHMRQDRIGVINAQPVSVVWVVELVKFPAAGQHPGKLVFQTQYNTMGTFCIGQPLAEWAEPTAMGCLGTQADHVVERLAANRFFTGEAEAAAPRMGWSEPPQPRVCMTQAPGGCR